MQKEELKAESKKLTSIDLFVTEKCNLDCSYCYHKKSDDVLSVEQGKNILNRLKVISPETMGINFFGGEPLLYPETVLELALYAKSLWEKTEFHISTNGTYFDEEMFEKFNELNMHVQVSFDGDEETQNKDRGQFELVRDNIVKMLKIYPELSVRMTFTPETVGFLTRNVQFIHRLGVKKIMHHATMEKDWTTEHVQEYNYQLMNLYHYRRWCQRAKIAFQFLFIDKTLKILNDEVPSEVEYCMAGKSYMAILPNGDVYPCHRAASGRLFKLGNVFNEKRPFVRGVFSYLDKDATGCLRFCEAARTCHSCVIAHFLVNKDLTKPLMKNKYCEICKVEYTMARAYLSTELIDKQERLLTSLSLVVADIADKLNELGDENVKK